jgi:aspartate/methionine/tyrosine aminotransferase
MKIKTFALERYFAKHEFSARYLLSCSDCEALSMQEVLELAGEEEITLWNDLQLSYTESRGHPLLLDAITDIYPGICRDNILTAAPEECVFLLMNALLESGDHVICTFPGYQSLYELARSIGCELSMWEPDEENGWHFDVRRLENLMQDNTKLVVVNFPHNPTGSLPGKKEYKAIVNVASKANIHLFSDEMYRFLEIADGGPLPAACEHYDKAVSLSGLSKAFGLPGLRVGWVVTRDLELLEKMGALKDYTTICSSAPSEVLALIAVRHRNRIIARQRKRIQKNLAALDIFFEKHAALFRWNRPGGGSICFPRILFTDPAEAFCERLVKETGIMLVPSDMFNYGSRHVRIGFGRDNLPEVLERFAEYLKKKLGHGVC